MSTYVKERLAQIRTVEIAKAREQEAIAALREERLFLTKAQKEQRSLLRAKVGHVYFIKAGGLVKIGFSSDVLNRMSNLRVGCPVDSELVAVIPGTEDTELYFHKMYKSTREKGEWFRLEGQLADFIKRMPSSVAIPDRGDKPPIRL